LEDEGRSKCEFTMIVAYRKVNLRQTQDRKKTKLCGETELINYSREINKLNKRKKKEISYMLDMVMFAQTCVHYVYLVILLCTLEG
jgi:hypothetical protein